MKKAFTLIEIIFVIIIIGVLAVVAIPKFSSLGEVAKVNNLFKVINDFKSNAPATYMNLVDLDNENRANVAIDQLVQVKGKDWHVGKIAGKNSWYWYGKSESSSIARIVFHNKLATNSRKIEINIWCDRFSSEKAKDECTKYTGINADKKYKAVITW